MAGLQAQMQHPCKSFELCRFRPSRRIVTVPVFAPQCPLPRTRWVAKAEGRDSDRDASAQEATKRLQELADALSLPPKFLSRLPNDIRIDLKDAAFALSNGPVTRECGEEVGALLMQLAKAWEEGDTQSVERIAKAVPFLQRNLADNPSSRSALRRRLVAAGRLFQASGKYGDGELQEIGKALIAAGEAVSAASKTQIREEDMVTDSPKALKFGTLQVEITSGSAFTGVAIALAFGFLSWQLTQALQNIDNTTNYANDNAILLATSLRGALLALGYSSSLISGFSALGLIALGLQLRSEGK